MVTGYFQIHILINQFCKKSCPKWVKICLVGDTMKIITQKTEYLFALVAA